MTPAEKVVAQVDGFNRLYDAFYTYFTDKLSKDDSKFSKYRLQLLTVYYNDDLELMKKVYPEFNPVGNIEEKKACARAALYDALVAHTFSEFLGNASQAVHQRMDVLEKASGTLLTQHSAELAGLKKEVENLKVVKEPINAIPERKQTRSGKKAGVKE